jgi:hypothetical protein
LKSHIRRNSPSYTTSIYTIANATITKKGGRRWHEERVGVGGGRNEVRGRVTETREEEGGWVKVA